MPTLLLFIVLAKANIIRNYYNYNKLGYFSKNYKEPRYSNTFNKIKELNKKDYKNNKERSFIISKEIRYFY